MHDDAADADGADDVVGDNAGDDDCDEVMVMTVAAWQLASCTSTCTFPCSTKRGDTRCRTAAMKHASIILQYKSGCHR